MVCCDIYFIYIIYYNYYTRIRSKHMYTKSLSQFWYMHEACMVAILYLQGIIDRSLLYLLLHCTVGVT